MNKKLTSGVAVVLLICFLFVFAISFLSPYIASADTTQDKINQKENEKQELQDKIDEKEGEKEDILTRKQALEERITEVENELSKIQQDIDEYNTQIAEKEIELAETQEKADAQYETMKTRLRVMYEDNSTSYITMIFSNDSLNDVLSYVEIIKQLLDFDNEVYDRLLETKRELENIKTGLETAKEKVVEQQTTYQERKDELDTKNAELQGIVDSLNTDIEEYKAAYEKAEQEEEELKKQLAEELSRTNAPSSVPVQYTGGKFTWPSPGYYTITSEYGYRHHPTLGVYKLHTGMDIGVPSGSTIVAAASGTVIKAQYNVAYGYYVVIDHGGGYSTLYAHNSRLIVSAGQSVSAGQQIAYSGNTGYSTGPHCHFEVMINGSTTNPRDYF